MKEQGRNNGQEVFTPEGKITPESLLMDNQSWESRERTIEWGNNRKNGQQRVIWTCPDARVIIPDPCSSINLRHIAAGGEPTRFEKVINNKSVEYVVVMSHHDQETVVNGQTPGGCGGLGVKKDKRETGYNSNLDHEGVEKYIKEQVQHHDVIIQACLTAEHIAEFNKVQPIFVVTQDHLTGKVYPIAAYKTHGNAIVRIIPHAISRHLYDGNYKPKDIYKNGIPTLETDSLPDEFKNFVEQSENESLRLRKTYPNLRDLQKVQSPDVIVLSSKLRPLRTRYAQTFEKPGCVFEIAMPREKANLELTLRNLKTVIGQLQYPVVHASENWDMQDKPFGNTKTIIIETQDLEASSYLAGRIRNLKWMKEWISRGGKIIIVESKGGKTNKAELFTIE